MKKFAIAPTDIDWFEYLKSNAVSDMLNFWTPTPWNIKQLKEGDIFYFLLKSPIRKIGGYAKFMKYENLLAREAWDRYGRGNGVKNFNELVLRATKYATKNSQTFIPTDNPRIGCIILSNYYFFNEDEYFVPEDKGWEFPSQIVKLKYFSVYDDKIFPQIRNGNAKETFSLVDEQNKKKHMVIRSDRKGQQKFRLEVLNAYKNKCSISGETCKDVIEAAHIQEYINVQSNHIQNGLPLRVDLHVLFDAGLITITTDYKVKVSSQLKSDEYKKFNDKKINLPEKADYYPSAEALNLHNKIVFRQ